MSEREVGELESRLDPRDREYVAGLDPERRDLVVSTILRYQQERALAVGDRLPELELHRLEDGERVGLTALLDGRPLALVFGSFT